jgi:hypothetical protein
MGTIEIAGIPVFNDFLKSNDRSNKVATYVCYTAILGICFLASSGPPKKYSIKKSQNLQFSQQYYSPTQEILSVNQYKIQE